MNWVVFVVEGLTALLIVASGVLALIGAVGVLRLPDFFMRLHPPALAFTLGSWCSAAATVLYLSHAEGHLALATWLIPLLLAITVPVTTLLLARAGLFRLRQAGKDVPPPLR